LVVWASACKSRDKAGGEFTDSSGAPRADTAGLAKRRLALVIGNAAYSAAPLRNPANDARGMRAALEQAHFEVHGGTDLSLEAMNDSLEAFLKLVRKGDVALFYFAGHGMQLRGENFLIPIDARFKKESDVRLASINVQQVVDDLANQNPALAIVILDACRDNPFTRSVRSFLQGLAAMDAPVGALVAYATAPKSVASDGSGKNGLYTGELLRAMRAPGRELGDVFRRVRHEVHHRSSGAQTPWESVATYEDFYFFPAAGSTPEPQPAERVAYRTDTLPVDTAPALDTIYANGVGAFRFGASPAEVNRMLPAPYGTTEWTDLPVAGEYRSEEVRYFWVPLGQFAAERLPFGELYSQCRKPKSESYITFLFTRAGLFRVSIRFFPDCLDGSAVVHQMAEQYGLPFRQGKNGSFFEWAGKDIVFAGVAETALPNVPALEWVTRDGPKYEGQEWWSDPRD
jgi:hypothetical protein